VLVVPVVQDDDQRVDVALARDLGEQVAGASLAARVQAGRGDTSTGCRDGVRSVDDDAPQARVVREQVDEQRAVTAPEVDDSLGPTPRVRTKREGAGLCTAAMAPWKVLAASGSCSR
jgi:hypothetical protein